MEKRSKVLLFIGSGVSLDPGMPNVTSLTERIFQVESDELTSVHPLFCVLFDSVKSEQASRRTAISKIC